MDVKVRTRPYYDRRCKNKMSKTKFDSLPDDVVFDILVRIPAQDIHNAARLVSPKWYKIIHSPNFMSSHLRRHTTCGLLIQNRFYRNSPLTFVAMQNGRTEISKLSYADMRFILSSCDGLVLERSEGYHDFSITNPVTKRRIALPQKFPDLARRSNAIAYAPTSMAYKVVHLTYDWHSKSLICGMLTVGVDKSRRHSVISQHISEKAKCLVGRRSCIIQGFVLWANHSNVLMLDVETEIFTQFYVPQFHGERLEHYFFPAGNCLSLLVGHYNEFSWEAWEMKPETGEWKKLPNIDFEAQKGMFEQLCLKHYDSSSFRPIPVGWLKYQEVLVFNVCERRSRGFRVRSDKGLCIAYNIHSQEIESFELDSRGSSFFPHRNSLVALNGC